MVFLTCYNGYWHTVQTTMDIGVAGCFLSPSSYLVSYLLNLVSPCFQGLPCKQMKEGSGEKRHLRIMCRLIDGILFCAPKGDESIDMITSVIWISLQM